MGSEISRNRRILDSDIMAVIAGWTQLYRRSGKRIEMFNIVVAKYLYSNIFRYCGAAAAI